MYLAQRVDTTEGYFCQLVDSDMQLIDIQMGVDQITAMTSYDLKQLVKQKAKLAAFKHLMTIKETK